MNLEGAGIHAYLWASMLACWALMRATGRAREIKVPAVNNPRAQQYVALALFIAATAAAIGANRLADGPFDADRAGVLFSALVIAMTLAAASSMKDSPATLGISLRGAQTILIFAVPAAGLAFPPRGDLNMALFAAAAKPSVFITAFALELFFRGYIQTRFEAARGPAAGILIAAAAYTAFHLPSAWGMFEPAALAVYLVFTFIIWGCGAGVLFRLSGNVFGIAMFHAFWDISLRAFSGMNPM